MADVVIFGAGRAAQAMKFYLEWAGEHRVVGFTVDSDWLNATTFESCPVVPSCSWPNHPLISRLPESAAPPRMLVRRRTRRPAASNCSTSRKSRFSFRGAS